MPPYQKPYVYSGLRTVPRSPGATCPLMIRSVTDLVFVFTAHPHVTVISVWPGTEKGHRTGNQPTWHPVRHWLPVWPWTSHLNTPAPVSSCVKHRGCGWTDNFPLSSDCSYWIRLINTEIIKEPKDNTPVVWLSLLSYNWSHQIKKQERLTWICET